MLKRGSLWKRKPPEGRALLHGYPAVYKLPEREDLQFRNHMGVIRHGGARTRALYHWENVDLCLRPDGRKQLKVDELNRIAEGIWATEGWTLARLAPQVHIIRDCKAEYSWTIGKKQIYLLPPNPNAKRIPARLGGTNAVVLIHELTHAKGYGDYPGQMHSVAFVKLYLKLLSKYLGWDHDALVAEAKRRRLI